MGKSKGSARTKGNTRPSSSGHSAELLSSTGIPTTPGFIGFQNYPKDTLGLKCASFTVPEDVDKGGDDGCSRILMKKMLKRDAVTKLKAVQEFMDYCSDDDHDGKCILPYWPRLFNKLALDSDKRVRELIHKANEILILKVKRGVAPYLKSFMGTWLITQCDPYAPAASAAQAAFASAFPQPKQSEALMFCRSEIIKMIRDNLFIVTPKSFSEPNVLTEGECEEKYQLVVTCTIAGMKLFVSTLCEDDRENVWEDVNLIVLEKSFWAYSQSKVPQIRGAWYGLITTLCHDMSMVFGKVKPKLILSVMGSLAESDPIVAPAIWECALQVSVSFEDWWRHINFVKAVLPQLWKFLKHGGMGNAVSVFPCLLPFLSRLPEDVTGTGVKFNQNFYSSMIESFILGRLKISSECNAVVKAFLECFKYSIDKAFDDFTVIEYLIKEQLIPLVKISLTPDGSHVAASSFFPLLGQYLQQLESQSAQYNNFLTLFWKELYAEVIRIIDTDHLQHDRELTTLARFFFCLIQPTKYISGKKKIRFRVESAKADSVSVPFLPTLSAERSYLFRHAVKTCAHLCRKLQSSLDPCCLRLCTGIICSVRSVKLFSELLTALRVPVAEVESPCVFFEEVVLKWVQLSDFDCVSLDYIANTVLSICTCVESFSALDLLDTCSKVECQKLYCRLIIKILDSGANNALYNDWFRRPMFGIVLKTMTTRLFVKLVKVKVNTNSSQVDIYRKTLLKCITEASSENPKIPPQNVDTVLSTCLAFLPGPSGTNVMSESLEEYTFFDLVGDICGNLFRYSSGKWHSPNLDSLIFRVFCMSLDPQKYKLLEKQRKQLCDIWQMCITNLGCKENKFAGRNCILTVLNHLHEVLLTPLVKEMPNHVVEMTLDFLIGVEKVYRDLFAETVGRLFPSLNEWENLQKGLKLSTVPALLNGKWFYPMVPRDHAPISRLTSSQLVTTAEALSHISCKIVPLECKEILTKPLQNHMPYLLWALCYAESMEYFTIQTEKDPNIVSNLQKNCEMLVTLLEYSNLQELVANLLQLSLCDAAMWASPFEKLLEIASSQHPGIAASIPSKLTDQIKIKGVLDKYITLQVCLRNAPCEFRMEFIDSVPKDFFNIELSSPDEPDYFGVLCEASCCIQKLETEQILSRQEKILGFLPDLINYHRVFGCDKKDSLSFATNFVAIASVVLREIPSSISCNMWSSIMEVAVAMFKRCTGMGDRVVKDTSVLIFMHQTCKLICTISQLFEKRQEHEDTGDYHSLPVNAKWHQLFNDTISGDFLRLFLQVAKNVRNLSQSSDAIESLMIVLSQVMEYLNTEQVVATLLPTQSGLDQIEIAYGKLRELTLFLTCDSLAIQFGIHLIISKVIVHIPKLLIPKSKTDDDQEDDDSPSTFPLIEVLKYTNDIVETMLEEVSLGECCSLMPYTHSYTYTLAYLLSWIEVLEFFSVASSEVRSMYACYLDEEQLLSSLLMNLIRLRPENPSLCFGHIQPKSTTKKHQYEGIFIELPPISSLSEPSSKHLQHVVCFLYYNTMRKVPALVRKWWSNLDKKTADVVEKFTSKYISGLLSMTEINVVRSGNVRFSNMTIKACPLSREVIATYTLDDSAIELSIQLPPNYPLGPIVADSRRKMGVGHAQWRNWLLQLTTFLNYHNGSIVDALALWKKNLDKKFEGVEECMICYFVLHSSSCKLPSVSCSACKKKFHSSCLYKWFSTSNNSTCPGCRNYF